MTTESNPAKASMRTKLESLLGLFDKSDLTTEQSVRLNKKIDTALNILSEALDSADEKRKLKETRNINSRIYRNF